MNIPETMKASIAMRNDVPATRPLVFKRSDNQAAKTVTTYATAYGGTVYNWASRPLYPSPATMVGEKSDSEVTPLPMAK